MRTRLLDALKFADSLLHSYLGLDTPHFDGILGRGLMVLFGYLAIIIQR